MFKYDEFFVTPSGTVDIRRFLPGKKGEFEQTTIGKGGVVPDQIYGQLQMVDRAALNLWTAVQELLAEFPYPAHAFVFGISKGRSSAEAQIEFQIATKESGLDLSQIRCWKPQGPKRWGWKVPTSDSEVSSCIASSFEYQGLDVGGGWQVTYFPISIPVVNIEDAEAKLKIAEKVFEETGIGPFILEPKPWSDAE